MKNEKIGQRNRGKTERSKILGCYIYNVLRPIRNSQTLRSCIMRRICSRSQCTNDAEQERKRGRERETDKWRVAPSVISEGE